MLRTRGLKVQDNWDLWLNVSVFAYSTTVSCSTGVKPHYAMFGLEATLPVDWVFLTPSVEKRRMYHWTGDMMEKRQRAYKSMRGRVEAKRLDVQAINTKYPSRMSSMVF